MFCIYGAVAAVSAVLTLLNNKKELLVAWMQNGGIRHRRYPFELPYADMGLLRDTLKGRKIPVLFDGFDRFMPQTVPPAGKK